MNKIIKLLFFTFLCFQSLSQNTFEIFVDSLESPYFTREFSTHNDFIRVLNDAQFYADIVDVDYNGTVLRKTQLNDFIFPSKTSNVLVKGKDDMSYIAGSKDNLPCLAVVNKNLEDIQYQTFEIDTGLYAIPNSMIEINETLVLAGNVYLGRKYNHNYWVPFIIWYDKATKEYEAKLILDKDTNGHINSIHLLKDSNGYLVAHYYRQYHNPTFSNWIQGWHGFKKFNLDREEVWSWEDTELVSMEASPWSAIDKDNIISFIKFKEGSSFSNLDYPLNFNSIVFVDSLGLMDREINSQLPAQRQLIRDPAFFNIIGDKYYVYESVNGYDSIVSPAHHISVLSLFDKDGNREWFRIYRKLLGNGFRDHQAQGKHFAYFNFVSGVGSQDDNIIFGGQMIRHLNPTTKFYSWLCSVDSLGCFDDDICNDLVYTNKISEVPVYDQPSMPHKKYFYNSQFKDGTIAHYEMKFTKDTFLTEIAKGGFSYRFVNYINEHEKIRDKRAVGWMELGRVYFAQIDSVTVKQVWRVEERLYDFGLRLNELFTLPDSLGTARVISVDSINFLNGYKRKRIILRFEDDQLREAFGDMIWVDGIGALNFGFFYQDDLKGHIRHTLTCYYDRNILKYRHLWSQQCLLSNVIDDVSHSGIKVYPNPTNSILNISFTFENELPKSFIIFNAIGQEITRELTNNQTELSINVQDYKPMMYYIQFLYDNKKPTIKKWIKI